MWETEAVRQKRRDGEEFSLKGVIFSSRGQQVSSKIPYFRLYGLHGHGYVATKLDLYTGVTSPACMPVIAH